MDAFVALSVGPFVTLFVAAVLRLIAASQSDSAWNHNRRAVLLWCSYLLAAISIVGMILVAINTGHIAFLAAIAVPIILAVSLLEVETRIAGVRYRAQQVEFLWVLATAIQSKRPLEDEIESYAQGFSGKRYRRLTELAERLRDGTPLSEIAVPNGLLPRQAQMQLQMGISTKSTQEALQESAVRFTRLVVDEQTAPHAGRAFIYPVALIPIIVGIVIFLMYFIIPKIKLIFDDFGTELPDITRMLISTSNVCVHYWYMSIMPLFYLSIGLIVLVVLAEYHGWQSTMQLIFGRWFIRAYSPDVLRCLSRSTSAKVPLDQALLTLAKMTRPRKLRERLLSAGEQLVEGNASWPSLQKTGIINSHEAILLELAERSGNLPWVLETLAATIERRRTFRINALFEVLQPAMIVLISISVAFIVFAMFMPLVKLLNDFS